MNKQLLVIAAGVLAASAATAGPLCLERASFTTPTSRFIVSDTADAVTDGVTRLVWQRCPLGQTLDNANTPSLLEDDACAQSSATRTWSEALTATVTFNADQARAGLPADWRVPNRKELAAIEELKCVFPALNPLLFPGVRSGSLLWSSSPITDAESSSVWVLDIWNGGIIAAQKSTSRLVHLVRDGDPI
jgi:hypothetical protein